VCEYFVVVLFSQERGWPTGSAMPGDSLIDTLLGLDPEYKFLMGVVALVILYGLQHLARALWKWAWPHIKELIGNHLRLRRAREAIATDSRGIWLTIPARAPKGYRRWLRNSIPIILVANLKGGVGKTTLTAYLAAYFATGDDGASRQARRVLVSVRKKVESSESVVIL
jgi:hypothetical protein